jgi:prepilin-type N-terminal cleavage/methylation domain-containing protein
MQIKQKRNSGFTLVEIMVTVAIIGLVAVLAIPNAFRAREAAQLNGIINNLRIIEESKTMWAIEKRKGTSEPVTQENLEPYMKGGRWIEPLANEKYYLDTVGVPVYAQSPVKLVSVEAETKISAF